MSNNIKSTIWVATQDNTRVAVVASNHVDVWYTIWDSGLDTRSAVRRVSAVVRRVVDDAIERELEHVK